MLVYKKKSKLITIWMVNISHIPCFNNTSPEVDSYHLNPRSRIIYSCLCVNLIVTFATIDTPFQTDADDDGSGSEKVERARRAHLNDLENIVPYILVSFVYTMTAPYPIVAINLFRVAAGARIWHTIVYAIFPLRQPARAIGFFVPMLIMLYMSVQTAIFFLMVG